MSAKSIVGKIKYAFAAFNEKICFTKEISSIGNIGTVKLLKGGFAKFLNFAGRYFAYTSTRTYGSFFLSFGLVSLFLQFAEFYFKSEPGDAFSYIIISAAVALFGIPFLIFDIPMCIALQDFSVTDYIFFEFLSIKRMHITNAVNGIKMLGGIFLGFIPAVISFYIPIQYVLLALLLIIITVVAITTPEFPMILMILMLPYVSLLPYSEMILVSVSLLTFVSYALKVVLGKRTYNFSIYDIIIFALALISIVGGFFGDGDDAMKNAVVFSVLLLIYFPANNLIVNRRIADLAINAVVISSIPIAALSIIEFVVESSSTSYTPPIFSTPGITVFFESPETLSAFLLVSAVLSVAYSIEKRRTWKKVIYLCVFALEIVVLGLSLQPFVWLAVFLGIPAYFIITSKNIPLDLLMIIIFLPIVLFMLPTALFDAFYKSLGISPNFSGMIAGFYEAFDTWLDNILLGVGVGDASYNAATSSSVGGLFNTPLGIAVELGIFAFILFMLLLLILLRQLSYYRRFMTNSAFITIKDMSALAITALMIYGMGTHVFEDSAILTLFFAVFGISSSAMRSARADYDDRLSYYGDSRSSESSVIDVYIR